MPLSGRNYQCVLFEGTGDSVRILKGHCWLDQTESGAHPTDPLSVRFTDKSVQERYYLSEVSLHKAMFGISASWQYFESGHGKGPCDGVGGSVKRAADRAVKTGKLIKTAQDFYAWGISERHSQRCRIYLSRKRRSRKRQQSCHASELFEFMVPRRHTP